MKKILIFSLILFCLCLNHARGQKALPDRYNVLFVFVDDLRPDFASYGNPDVRSPNLDQLARQSAVFLNQYVTVPTCGASRASILTGKLPQTNDDLSNDAFEHNRVKKTKDIPESFIHALRKSGYYTVGIGKISHSPDGYIYPYTSPVGTELELPFSWDEMLFNAGKWGTGWNAFFGYSNGSNRNTLKGAVKPFEQASGDDELYPDGLTAKLAMIKLKELAGKKQPFFLGVGFFKPHLPFNAPKKYWDMYKESEIKLTHSPDIPKDVNLASLHQSTEFNGYKLGDEKPSLSNPVSDSYARQLRHGYYASISYVDAQIGKVLEELKRLHLDKNTIVIVWGDHGWHLGDHRIWGKHTISEYALRSPLMIKVPGTPGVSSGKIISSTDVYPTLMDLCKVTPPHNLDGKSLIPLLKNPNDPKWGNVAYSYFRKGITLRTERYRLTKYFRKELPSVELYDYQKDPYEKVNIAGIHPEIVQSLMPLWNKGNTGLYNKVNSDQ